MREGARRLTLVTPTAARTTEGPELLLRLKLDADALAALLRLVEQGALGGSAPPKLIALRGGKPDAPPG